MFRPLNALHRRVTARILAPHRLVLQKSTVSPKAETLEEDEPVRFTTSEAKNWKARTSLLGERNTRLWYEPHVILASIITFMVYFTMIREENEIDVELTKTLYSRIDGLEEHQLRASLAHNERNNLDTSAIKARLLELEQLKQ